MNGTRQEDAQRLAFENLSRTLDRRRRFPNQVFKEGWSIFLFFESDWVFDSGFSDVLNEILTIEGGRVACLLNIDKTSSFEFEKISSIFVDQTTTRNAYEQALERGGPEKGWIYLMDSYVCMSDVGDWCFYCERSNDIAVMALREAGYISRFQGPLDNLLAKPIEALLDGGCSPLFPFDHLVPAWRKVLLENYGGTGSLSRSPHGQG
ncbi:MULTISPECIES: hypothetical protein [Cupriavidus]